MWLKRFFIATILFTTALGHAAHGQRGSSPSNTPLPTGQIVVRVRTQTGSSLGTPASVRLYSDATSQQYFSSLQGNAQAIFQGIPVGVYRVQVSAPGYNPADEEATLWAGNSTSYVDVELRPEGFPKPADSASSAPLLAPKVREELEKGLEFLRANDLQEAQKRLEHAAKKAPGHPDPPYLLGLLYLRQHDPTRAKAYLEKAISLYPGHASALAVLGGLLYEEGNDAGAAANLEKAVEQNSTYWEAHWTLASTYYRAGQFENARAHAQRALELSKGRAPAIQLLLGQTLAALGENEKAARVVEAYLRQNSGSPAAPQAHALLEQVRGNNAKTQLDRLPPAAPAPSVSFSVPPRRWAPPDVDESIPVVDSNATCSLPAVLAGAAQRAVELAKNVSEITATEHVEQSELDERGNPRGTVTRDFEYLVSIREVRSQTLAVEETRSRGGEQNSFPGRLVANGLAVLPLIFHPYYVEDFEMHCEGLGRWNDQPAWLVHFRQRDDRPNRVRSYQTGKGRFLVPLRGRAWVSASRYHVVRLETELVRPMKEIDLEREHQIVEYQPVKFAQRDVVLWLPSRAELFALFRSRRYHDRHTFSGFLLFGVDVNQKIKDPKQP